MAVPKRRQSKARSAKRKANWKLELPTIVKCSHCHAFKLPHRVCKECGYYNGKEVVKMTDDKAKEKAKAKAK